MQKISYAGYRFPRLSPHNLRGRPRDLVQKGQSRRKVGVILPQPRPFPESRRRRRERPRRPFAAVEPVEHFHQRRDRPDVALGDELASSALNLAKANPRLRPLHLVVRETEFCGLRLAGYFRRRMRENSRNSVRRPRCASLTRRNYGGFCLPGNRPGLSGLHGGGCRDRTDGHRSLASLQTRRRVADLVRETICRSECQSRSRAN